MVRPIAFLQISQQRRCTINLTQLLLHLIPAKRTLLGIVIPNPVLSFFFIVLFSYL